jgi:hypothetical protein
MRTHRLIKAVMLAGLFALPSSGLTAQAVTTGSITGYVTNEQGQPVEAAQIQVTNRNTGFTAGQMTNSTGRYMVAGLELGSNYAVTVRRIGMQPQTRENVPVSLGQASRVDFKLSTSAVVLSGVTVTAEQAEVITPSRTGAVTAITDTALRRLPTLNRNFTDFVALTPQVSTTLFNGGLSGGGTNNRYNNVQIDGTSEADIFGLGATGQPGGQASGKSIGLEAVKEYKVMLSPYDVRQGFFAGLLVNAVTKSGTNDVTGTAFVVQRDQGLTRKQPYITEYEQLQYGFSVGGPIIRNKAFFFFSPEFQQRTSPASGPYVGQTGVSITQARVDSFTTALGAYGIPTAGTWGVVNNTNPLANMFGRIDVNLPYNSQLVLRYNYGSAEDDNFSRSSSSFKLSNNGYFFNSKKHAPAAQLRTLFSNGSFNELMLSYTRIRDRRTPFVQAPEVTVQTPGFDLVAGSERFSHGNELDQDVVELTENFTKPFGSHRLTVGTQNQFYKFRNLFAQSIFGVWRFSSIDSLRTGRPNQYIIGVPLRPNSAGTGVEVGGDGAVRFSSSLHSMYLQDEWEFNPRLNFSFGLRADLPLFSDKPPTNPSVLTNYQRNTADFPSGNIQWSPRVAFNWDVLGDATNQLRGGIGLFTGRPAYVWLANGFQNSGMGGVALLTCGNPSATAANRPQPFNAANVSSPPTTCGGGASAALGGEINLVDPDFKFPQNLRGTLGYDRRIVDNWVTTAELLYTRGVNSIFYRNVALMDSPAGVNRVEQRAIYGTAPGSPIVKAIPAGPCPATSGCRTQMYEASNQSKDWAVSLTGGLQRRYWNNYEGSLFYTYTRAYDVMSFTSSTAFSQLRFGRPWGGDLLDQTATRSSFEQRHRIIGQGTYTFPTKTDVSIIYMGESGAPYTYIAAGDLNGDGYTLNDPVYVPVNANDAGEFRITGNLIVGSGSTARTYTPAQQREAFEAFIKDTPCLNENRGRILARNACDNPFTNTVNMSVRQSFRTFRLQHVTLQLDVFNFLNLLNKEWGEQPSAGTSPVTLLSGGSYTGTGTAGTNTMITGQPGYTFNPEYVKFLSNNLRSNYQVQLQARYSFR